MYAVKLIFINKDKIKTSPNKQNTGKHITAWLALQNDT